MAVSQPLLQGWTQGVALVTLIWSQGLAAWGAAPSA